MAGFAVNVAVIHENQILLTQRDDFEVWCLPSGGVEEGESAAQAALRETKEETGLEVELTRLVGVYSRLGGLPDVHAVLFAARVIGGEIKTQPGETIDVRFFAFDDIPEDLSLGHAQRIEDAIRGVGGGVAMMQKVEVDREVSLREIAALRQQPREVRRAFYREAIQAARLVEETEVGAAANAV
ncbi:MAG: NUDIX domain-containing protein [Anaerolineales bacterium]|jgi:ADP-ribose pyrophosphatase YjhB (NUDIX family)|nr:NUDIX domain-containing protein [Anaerolineales bacterium]